MEAKYIIFLTLVPLHCSSLLFFWWVRLIFYIKGLYTLTAKLKNHCNLMFVIFLQYWCSKDDGFGRLVNDDHINPHAQMKFMRLEGKPHLCLFAVRDTSPGEEVTTTGTQTGARWFNFFVKFLTCIKETFQIKS